MTSDFWGNEESFFYVMAGLIRYLLWEKWIVLRFVSFIVPLHIRCPVSTDATEDVL